MLRCEILSVGTELLLGQIVNTDAQFLSQKLSALGIGVYFHSTVGDNPQRMMQCLKIALERSDIVITTGGLGPTMDDITKETVAKYWGLEMVRDERSESDITGYFGRFGRPMTPNNLKQADFPAGAHILRNDCGTAPGCIVEKDGKMIIILPGPPRELTDMYVKVVEPFLMARSEQLIHSKVLRIFGVGESRTEHMLRDLIEAQDNPTIAPYAGSCEVTLRITARVDRGQDPMALIAPVEAEIRRRLGDSVYGQDEQTLESIVVEQLLAAGKTVALAESCTGGMLAAQLVSSPGASGALLEGVVAYSNAAKVRALGVSEALLAAHGAVSEQAARAMAEGMRRVSGADYALAVTGIAGPGGGSEQKPIGLVHIALCDAQGTIAKDFKFNGARNHVRLQACMNALDMLRRRIAGMPV